jgi:hypothetical protein
MWKVKFCIFIYQLSYPITSTCSQKFDVLRRTLRSFWGMLQISRWWALDRPGSVSCQSCQTILLSHDSAPMSRVIGGPALLSISMIALSRLPSNTPHAPDSCAQLLSTPDRLWSSRTYCRTFDPFQCIILSADTFPTCSQLSSNIFHAIWRHYQRFSTAPHTLMKIFNSLLICRERGV